MKKWVGLLIFAVATLAGAQNTSVSATVVDTDGITWANGTWQIEFLPNPNKPNISIYNINGTLLDPTVLNQTGSINGSGVLTVSIYQQAPISPVGSSWKLTVCPNAVSACGIYVFVAVGSSMNLSSALTSKIPAPRFRPVSGAYAYADSEATIQLLPGSTYWNVSLNTQRCYTSSGWGTCTANTGVTKIIPGTNITCLTNTSGFCIGDVTINASLAGAINQLTGDVLAGPGGGSQAATLATIGSAGSCGDTTHTCAVTFDTKGRETTQVNTAITFPADTGITQLTGDGIAGPGSGSQALTLATVNANVGSCGDSSHVGVATYDAKGRATGCTATAITYPTPFSVVATYNGATCTLGDDGTGGSGAQCTSTWSNSISGSYVWTCLPAYDPSATTGCANIGNCSALLVDFVSSTATTFTYYVNSRTNTNRGHTINLMCTAVQ